MPPEASASSDTPVTYPSNGTLNRQNALPPPETVPCPALLLLRQIDIFAQKLHASGAVTRISNNFSMAERHPEIYVPWVEMEVAPGLESVKVIVRKEHLEDAAHFAVQIVGAYPQRFWFHEETCDSTALEVCQQLLFQIAMVRSQAGRSRQ